FMRADAHLGVNFNIPVPHTRTIWRYEEPFQSRILKNRTTFRWRGAPVEKRLCVGNAWDPDAASAKRHQDLAECGDAGEDPAFHHYEESAVRGGQRAQFAGDPGMLERGDRITAAGDRDQRVLPRAPGDVGGHIDGSLVKWRDLECAERTAPDEGRRPVDGL